jgi:hypothetical protein
MQLYAQYLHTADRVSSRTGLTPIPIQLDAGGDAAALEVGAVAGGAAYVGEINGQVGFNLGLINLASVYHYLPRFNQPRFGLALLAFAFAFAFAFAKPNTRLLFLHFFFTLPCQAYVNTFHHIAQSSRMPGGGGAALPIPLGSTAAAAATLTSASFIAQRMTPLPTATGSGATLPQPSAALVASSSGAASLRTGLYAANTASSSSSSSSSSWEPPLFALTDNGGGVLLDAPHALTSLTPPPTPLRPWPTLVSGNDDAMSSDPDADVNFNFHGSGNKIIADNDDLLSFEDSRRTSHRRTWLPVGVVLIVCLFGVSVVIMRWNRRYSRQVGSITLARSLLSLLALPLGSITLARSLLSITLYSVLHSFFLCSLPHQVGSITLSRLCQSLLALHLLPITHSLFLRFLTSIGSSRAAAAVVA